MSAFTDRVLASIPEASRDYRVAREHAATADDVAVTLGTTTSATTRALRALVASGDVVAVPLDGLTVDGYRLADDRATCVVCGAPSVDSVRDENAGGPWIDVCGDSCADVALTHDNDCDCDACVEMRDAEHGRLASYDKTNGFYLIECTCGGFSIQWRWSSEHARAFAFANRRFAAHLRDAANDAADAVENDDDGVLLTDDAVLVRVLDADADANVIDTMSDDVQHASIIGGDDDDDRVFVVTSNIYGQSSVFAFRTLDGARRYYDAATVDFTNGE